MMYSRPFEKKDIDAVMHIWLSSNLEAHSFIPAEYWRKNTAAVRAMIPDAEVTVCEENGRVLGFIGITEEGYIAGIFVEEQNRSRGVGRLLMERAKQTHHSLFLHVYQKNESAVRFYLREGFVEEELQPEPDTGEIELSMIWKKPCDEEIV